MSSHKVLIVEDEILIADNIKRYLLQKDYDVTGIAISYFEAIKLYEQTNPDIVLLDIRLNGIKNGIDVARYINSHSIKKPFLFLTSQMDPRNIAEAKKTFPAGYLSKPIQQESLFATIEITLHNFNSKNGVDNALHLHDGHTRHILMPEEISFVQAEHVYVKVYKKDGEDILYRSTLKDILSKLPSSHFVQTHRSYVVNIRHITSWDTNSLYIGKNEIPMSRSKKKDVLDMLLKN